MEETWKIRRVTDKDFPGIARVHVDTWRTTYKGIVPDRFLDGMSYATIEARWRRISKQNPAGYAMFVAEVDEGHHWVCERWKGTLR